MNRARGYMPGLDGLRGIAVLLVLGYHLDRWRWSGGEIGVDIFFALSGFLITGILVRELDVRGRIAFRRFYLRRLVRLYPALLTTILLFLIPGVIAFGWSYVQHSTFAALYVTPFGIDFGWISTGPYAHTWTLTLEELFYLAWPLALTALFVAGVLARSGVALIVAGVATLGVSIVIEATSGEQPWPLRAGGMLLGCGVALIPRRGVRVSQTIAYIAAGGIAVSFLAARFIGISAGALLAAGASSVLILHIANAQTGPLSRALSWNPLRWLGVISYEIYLVHFPIILISNQLLLGFEVRRTVWAVVCGMLSIIVAAGIHYAWMPAQHRLRARIGELSPVGA